MLLNERIEDIDFDYMDQYIESIKKLYTNTRYQKRIGTIQQMKAMI